MASQAHPSTPAAPAGPPSAPSLLLPTFPGAALLVTSGDAPGSKLIIKLKREGPMVGGSEEIPRTQTFFVAGMPLGWATQRRDGPTGPGVCTVLLTKVGEEPGGRKPRVPESIPPPRAPPPSDASFACTSKGVYENYRRWQRYKALARRHFPATPDAEALACFFIPVLRSLARLRPDMTLEDGVPRAIQEWEHSSNFERMIFYEMAEKFMEFEMEEEQQIQKMKLLASCSQFPVPVPKPAKPPVSPVPEPGQQQVYIPKKSASKSRQPRRRQRRSPSTSAGAPREIPAEAVHQYAEIMEGLDTGWEEEDEKKEQGVCRDPQDQEDGVFPDLTLLQYIDQLCDDEEFVCKVEAVIHPQFMADLLSPEKNQDPLELVDELAEELHLTPNQLIEKRLLALSEEEREPSVYPTSHSDSTPSQSEEEDEISVNGKEGGAKPCQSTMKRPSVNTSITESKPEQFRPQIGSPLPHHVHQQVGDRNTSPKPGNSLSHKYGSPEIQEASLPPFLKRTDEREPRNSQVQDQFGDCCSEITPPVHCKKSEITPDNTGKRGPTTNITTQGDKVEQRILRPCTTEHTKQDGRETGRAGGQVILQGSHTIHSGKQKVWNNLESATNKYGKQDGNQREEVCLKKAQAIWEVEKDAQKVSDCDSQDLNKLILKDNMTGEMAKKMALNGNDVQTFDHTEKVKSQFCDSKGLSSSNRKQFDCHVREMSPHWDSSVNKSCHELNQTEYQKQDDYQKGGIKDKHQLQIKHNGNPAQLGNINQCGQGLIRQDHLKSAPPGPGNQVDGLTAKAKSQKLEIDWTQKKVRDNGSVKNMSSSIGNSSFQIQTSSTGQVSNQAITSSPHILETNEDNLKPPDELNNGNGEQMTLSDSSGVVVLENQLDTEHLPYFTVSLLESPSSIQKDCERLQWPLTDQTRVPPWIGNQLDDKEIVKPTLKSSGYLIMVETDGPGGDPSSAPSSPDKTITMFLSQEGHSSSHSHVEDDGPVSSDNDVKNTSKKEEGKDLLERVSVPKGLLPELPWGTVEGALKEDEEEDEELSSFSSLLASKLSLSPQSSHVSLSKEQGGRVLLAHTDLVTQSAKTRQSVRGQGLPQNFTALSNKNLVATATAHRSHKRKANGSGTRRSKRLRHQ